MKRIKDTSAYKELQDIMSIQVAGNFVSRLRAAGVPATRLDEISRDICYDIASAISAIGKLELPETSAPLPQQEDRIGNTAGAEEQTGETGIKEERDGEPGANEPVIKVDEPLPQEEKTDPITVHHPEPELGKRYHVEGVLTQEQILRILNAEKPGRH